MSRRILISFLGSGSFDSKDKRSYKTARYHIANNDLGDYSFVAAALEKHYKTDSTFLIGTVHSMWEEVYLWHCKKNGAPINEDTWLEIGEGCENANNESNLEIPHQETIEKSMGEGSKIILIKYGINEAEVRENIDTILGIEQYLKYNDEIIVDVTHSFRSLPLFMMNLLIYLQNVSNKRITISHVHYGMLEVINELHYAPIIDLKAILEINEWITGAYSFSQFGNAYLISKLLEQENKSVSNQLVEFSNLMNLNHLFAIRKASQTLSGFKNAQYSSMLPVMIINPIVNDFVRNFNPKAKTKDSVFQLKVAKWQLDHRKYAQAFLTLNEAIISFVCEINKIKAEDMGNRNIAKKALCPNYSGPLVYNDKLTKIYQNVRKLRNSTAHAVETKKNINKMINILKKAIIDSEQIFLESNRKTFLASEKH